LCEIDIVAAKDRVIYFVEVKFRSGTAQGSGFEYITSAKQRRMRFAAEVWRQANDYYGDFRLMAAAVSGMDCENVELLEL
jgi:Holliday junction resolvase-like predicted endonuclease